MIEAVEIIGNERPCLRSRDASGPIPRVNPPAGNGFSSLYVHVPFCRAKCDYCAFYSIPSPDAAVRAAYLERLTDEFHRFRTQAGTLQSVFIGGGTPSFLEFSELRKLLETVRSSFDLAPDSEFTIECNPSSLSQDKIKLLKAMGANRISLGVQTFSPKLLRVLGRRGQVFDVEQLVAVLRENDLPNISLDLIYGIPGQTERDWEMDLRRTCAMAIRHVSTYELTIEEGTRLSTRHSCPDEELARGMWFLADEILNRAGMCRYEVSNFAEPGAECRHNLEIWHGGTYLGCGPAATSFDGVSRWTNPADLERWLAKAEPVRDEISSESRAAEVLAFGCRTTSGWDRACFKRRTGFHWNELRGKQLNSLAAEGLLTVTSEKVLPTQRGLLFADLIAQRLI